MSRHDPLLKKPVFLFLFIVGIWIFWPPSVSRYPFSAAGTPHKVHIAFGFHVNLYHSFRGDTNDENGFGQDIRVIRHIIRELDDFNQQGVPVSAVWDFDSLFSLQEILPARAPDIIRDVQRRVTENKDDVILMSYNNGLVSAMDHDEFTASVERSISNSAGSGARDLFDRVAPVVRPQEMMTTPGHFERYRASGIEYVSLYYSATPFDGFRLFSRELSPTEAHNPVRYQNPDSGEEIVILPTYHAGDLVEHVSLRNWAESLHQRQIEGSIDRDVLIFVNFDADAEFWFGADLPPHLQWLPNTGGIRQVVDSVADLDYVSFSNVSSYLANHPPAGTVHFSQDTADGSFHGYHSWAEKAYASDYWTRIVRNRRAHRMAAAVSAAAGADALPPGFRALLETSFETRLRALSTTHFGLAAPFLTRAREQAMDALLTRLDRCTEAIETQAAVLADALIASAAPPAMPPGRGRRVETFLHLGDDGTDGAERLLSFTLPDGAPRGARYLIADGKGRTIPAAVAGRSQSPDGPGADVTLRISRSHQMPAGVYFLFVRADIPGGPLEANRPVFADRRTLRNGFITVNFSPEGRVTGVVQNSAAQLDAGSLLPYIVYRGRRLSPDRLRVDVAADGRDGLAAVRIHGPWEGPPEAARAPGWVDYRLRLLEGVPYLFIEGEVQYPDTYRRQVIHEKKPMLARKIDDGWEAVAPVELRFLARARKTEPFLIHKRNYLGQESAYPVDYYRHSSKNLDVASINNHITAAYAGVTTGGRGMAVAMNPRVNANFAFCPFTMTHLPGTGEFTIRANPFGTYDGEQLTPPTRGNRLGYEAVLLSAPQLRSAAPTYNGYRDRFELMVSFFDGNAIPDGPKKDLIAFARRPITIGANQARPPAPDKTGIGPLPPAGFMALNYQNGILFHWEAVGGPDTEYRIRYGAPHESAEKTVTVVGRTAFVDTSRFTEFDRDYIATVEALHPDGSPATPPAEIRFRPAPQAEDIVEIPKDFAARLLWANLSAWLRRNLL